VSAAPVLAAISLDWLESTADQQASLQAAAYGSSAMFTRAAFARLRRSCAERFTGEPVTITGTLPEACFVA